MKKTFKQWQKSNLNRDKFLNRGDEIDEEMYFDIIECVPSEYSDEIFGQNGEPGHTVKIQLTDYKKLYYHETVFRSNNGKFYYLGELPSFEQLQLHESINN